MRLTASYTGRIRSRPGRQARDNLRHNPAASRAARILVAAMRHSRASRSTSSQFAPPRLAEPARGSMVRYAYPVLVDRGVDQIGREDALRVLTPIWSSKHALGVRSAGVTAPSCRGVRHTAYVDHTAASEGIGGAGRDGGCHGAPPDARLPRGHGCSREPSRRQRRSVRLERS